MTQPATYARVTGTGRYLPNEPISNQDLVDRMAAQGIETSDEWIRTRSGITQRYWANDDQPTSLLAEHAARAAMEMAGVVAEDIEAIIVATSTADMIFPSTACHLQNRLGATNAFGFDAQAACAGFVYCLTLADSLIRSGQVKTALVVGAEIITDVIDEQDRTTAVLFGDGAGAFVVQASDTPGIMACDLHSDGGLGEILFGDGKIRKGEIRGRPAIQMDGQAVFKNAVTFLGDSALVALEKAGLTIDSVDWYVPHQANIRIIQAAGKRMGLSEDKAIITVDQHANTSAASVPMAFDVAVRDGRIQKGQSVLLQGVGAGFAWGSVVLTF